jgi:arsenate reductase (thioredoxin)
MPDPLCNVLFICCNPARSFMAEALSNHLGAGRFRAFSAGSEGGPDPKPMVLKVPGAGNIPATGLTSKTRDEFAAPAAPEMDIIITVCDRAAGEGCPARPGEPSTAHRGIEDPSRVEGTEIERERAFVRALHSLRNRITALLSLPLASLDQLALQRRLGAIGDPEGSTSRRPEAA